MAHSRPDAQESPSRMLTVQEGYLWGREHLAASGSTEAAIEAEVLLRFALRLDRAGLYTRWMQPLDAAAWDRFRRLLDERATGRPVPYIVGEREFMGLPFAVDERVMIPRPETERLVECVIRTAGTPPVAADALAPIIVDVGTGSGCIAVSVAHFVPHAAVIATDVSADALAVAQANARRYGVAGRIRWLHGDLLDPLPSELGGQVRVIVSNPPYVPRGQREGLAREIRDFEPSAAVFVDGDGIGIHRRLIADAPRWLAPDGLLAMEVGFGQAAAVAGAIRRDGRYTNASVEPDYAGIPRVVAAQRKLRASAEEA